MLVKVRGNHTLSVTTPELEAIELALLRQVGKLESNATTELELDMLATARSALKQVRELGERRG